MSPTAKKSKAAARSKKATGAKKVSKKKASAKKAAPAKKKASGKKAAPKKKVATKKKSASKKKTTARKKASTAKKRTTAKKKTTGKPARSSKGRRARSAGPKLDISLPRFRRLLEAKHRELVHSYTVAKGNTRSTESDGTEDYIDYAVSSYDRDFMLSLTEMERRQLVLVEEALKRIERREFGRCLNCGTPIPERRLEVEPWARYCIPCQELDEQGLLDLQSMEGPFDDEDDPADEDAADDEDEAVLADTADDDDDDDDEEEADDDSSDDDDDDGFDR